MIYYTGTHVLTHLKSLDYGFISVNILRKRKSDFPANKWILDSGAFTELTQYGYYRNTPDEYADRINRWKDCGTMELAVTQDYMCEPFVLAKTGLTVKKHQEATIERYLAIVKLTDATIMPVLQGYEPTEYVNHLMMYGDLLKDGMRVGIGSVCKRNATIGSIVEIIQALQDANPNLRYHGFGLKYTALKSNYIYENLYSADSLAWSYAARCEGRDGNALSEAIKYRDRVLETAGSKPTQLYFR